MVQTRTRHCSACGSSTSVRAPKKPDRKKGAMDFTEEVFLWSVKTSAGDLFFGRKNTAKTLIERMPFLGKPSISSVLFKTSSILSHTGCVYSGKGAVPARFRLPSVLSALVALSGTDSAGTVTGTNENGGTTLALSKLLKSPSNDLATFEEKLSCQRTETEELDRSVKSANPRHGDPPTEELGKSQAFGAAITLLNVRCGLCSFTGVSAGISYALWRYISRGRRGGKTMWGEWKKQSRLEKNVARANLLAKKVPQSLRECRKLSGSSVGCGSRP